MATIGRGRLGCSGRRGQPVPLGVDAAGQAVVARPAALGRNPASSPGLGLRGAVTTFLTGDEVRWLGHSLKLPCEVSSVPHPAVEFEVPNRSVRRESHDALVARVGDVDHEAPRDSDTERIVQHTGPRLPDPEGPAVGFEVLNDS
jgi:hypothetical protein